MLIDSGTFKEFILLAFAVRNVKLQHDLENDSHGIGYRLSEHDFSRKMVEDTIRMFEEEV